MLKTGFARCDITPPLGVSVEGYFEPRKAKGVLDPLLATAVAFADGVKKAVVISVDVIGMNMAFMSVLRSEIANATGIDVDGVFVCCTHTHLGPAVAATGVTALSVGDVVFTGFPGELFVEVGKEVKARSPFELTIPACCANGYEEYYPVKSAYDEGGYEVLTARYAEGTAEKLIETSLEIINSLK